MLGWPCGHVADRFGPRPGLIAGALAIVLQPPAGATVLFSGSVYFWLYPPGHFYAILNTPIYHFMNLTPALDGNLFCAMVLATPARPGAPRRRTPPTAP